MSKPEAVPLLDLKPQYQALKTELDAAVAEVVDSQYFILGPSVERFEHECARYCNTKFVIGVSSGTDAILVALMALGIGAGDEVITSPYTFFSTAGSIVRLGATPVFVDIDPNNFNIDAAQIEAAITSKTRAIMPVHLFGQMADMGAIKQLARTHNLFVIEDASQAIGSRQNDQPAGSLGDMGTLSFFPSKNLGGFGDGGMVVTNNDEFATTTRQLRNHGMEPKYFHARIGGNFRLDALQAAVLSVKLKHLDNWHEQRRKNAARYRQRFSESGLSRGLETLETGDIGNGIILPTEEADNYHIYNQFVIYSDRRDALMEHLQKNQVGCEIYYPLSLHQQECFRSLGYRQDAFPNSERAAAMSLALPVFPDLSDAQIERVVEVVGDFFKSI